MCLKRKVYYSCVLPAMTYGAETWSLTKQAHKKLAAAQTKMERSMLNITYHDRKTNTWVRAKTGVTDVIKTTRRMKWYWAGHISRLKDDRWTKRITTWKGRDYEEGQQKDGETIWMSIGMKPPGREQHNIGKLGNNMLRPSPNQGTIWLIEVNFTVPGRYSINVIITYCINVIITITTNTQ